MFWHLRLNICRLRKLFSFPKTRGGMLVYYVQSVEMAMLIFGHVLSQLCTVSSIARKIMVLAPTYILYINTHSYTNRSLTSLLFQLIHEPWNGVTGMR